MSKKTIFRLVVLTIFVVGAMGWASIELRVRSFIHQKVAVEKAKATAALPELLDLQAQLGANGHVFLTGLGSKSDAGPFLNAKIGWLYDESDPIGKKAVAQFVASLEQSQSGGLTLPADLEKLLQESRVNFLELTEKIDTRKIDFSWFNQLGRFDHWDIENNSPTALLTEFNPMFFPNPKFNVLIRWSQLRLLNGYQISQQQEAIAQVTHLARLAYSTESYLGFVVANAILFYVSEYQKRMGLVPLAEKNFFGRNNDFTKLSSGFFCRIFIDASELRLATTRPNTPGLCASLSECGWTWLAVRTPFKDSPAFPLQAYSDTIGTSPCRLRKLRQAWAGKLKFVGIWDGYLQQSVLSKRQDLAKLLLDTVPPSEEERAILIASLFSSRHDQAVIAYLHTYFSAKSTNEKAK